MNFTIKLSTFSVCMLFTLFVNGQQRSTEDPWWFEIEAIVFERNVATSNIGEDFPLEIVPIKTQNLLNFIADTLVPDFSLLRAGAKQCFQNTDWPKFPLQTVPYSNIDQNIIDRSVPSEQIVVSPSNRIDYNEFRIQVISGMLFYDDTHILENSPTSKWLTELAQTFDNLNQDFSDWRKGQVTPGYSGEFEMAPYLTGRPLGDSSISGQPFLESDFPHGIKLPKTLYCQWPKELEFYPSQIANKLKSNLFLEAIPKILDGIEYPFTDRAYTLPAEKLELRQLRRSIQRTRGLNVMLHTAWRQNVQVGRDKAPWYRFYAGKNLSKEFNYTGLPQEPIDEEESLEIIANENLFDQIQLILESSSDETDTPDIQVPELFTRLQESDLNKEFKEVWTLDGRIKVFIEYIGGTPYLHIDSDLNYRRPKYVDWMTLAKQPDQISVGAARPELTANGTDDAISVTPPHNFLQAYHFDQLRRVISNEIHYFDHPLFGMVLQVRRHKRPDPELPPDYYQ